MKYKVTTDNLAWFGRKRGDIIDTDTPLLGGMVSAILKDNPNWLDVYGEPLLVTNDGVDIKYGDYFFWVDREMKWHKEQAGRFTPNKEYSNSFSYLENAEKFISDNTPKFTQKDINSLISIIASIPETNQNMMLFPGDVFRKYQEWLKNKEL